MRVHTIINSHGLESGGAERLASNLHASLHKRKVDAYLFGLMDTGKAQHRRDQSPVSKTTYSLNLKSPYQLKAFKGILSYLQSNVSNGDIVHAHLSPCIFYCAVAKLLLPKKFALVMTEHNTHNRRRGTLKGKILDCFLYGMMDHIICISTGARKALTDWMPKTSTKSSVIHNGIPLTVQQLPQRPVPVTFKILSAGRLTKQKNYEHALKAFSIFSSEHPAVCEYWIAGSGEAEQKLKILAKELGVSNHVKFLGHVDNVAQLMKEADIFLIPSLWEGFGLAAVEAMHAGLPVIASNVEGLAELVDSQTQTGLLVDPHDPTSIAAAIGQLYQSQELRLKLGEAGYKRASDFSEEKMVDAYLGLYARLIA